VVRTQFDLTQGPHAALGRAAERAGVSMTEELQRLIDDANFPLIWLGPDWRRRLRLAGD
jgi:hypothetical protein